MKPAAIVTGASSGIGMAGATLLARAGYRVALVARRPGALGRACAGCGPGALPVAADVARPEDCTRIVQTAIDRFGRIDVVVNCAGIAPQASVDDTTDDILAECFAVNALGPAMLIARAWPHMKRQNAGCIVNISSMASIDPFTGFFGYAASKASVNLMALTCAREGKAHNIRAFAIAPGAVETPMLRSLFSEEVIPRSAALAPEEIALVIMECIDGRRDHQNGQVIPLPPR